MSLSKTQVCSNYAPGAKNGPAPGSHVIQSHIGRCHQGYQDSFQQIPICKL